MLSAVPELLTVPTRVLERFRLQEEPQNPERSDHSPTYLSFLEALTEGGEYIRFVAQSPTSPATRSPKSSRPYHYVELELAATDADECDIEKSPIVIDGRVVREESMEVKLPPGSSKLLIDGHYPKNPGPNNEEQITRLALFAPTAMPGGTAFVNYAMEDPTVLYGDQTLVTILQRVKERLIKLTPPEALQLGPS